MAASNTCATCLYYVVESGDGLCKRYPPVVLAYEDPLQIPKHSAFPVVKAEDWCGEWKKRNG